MGVCISELLRSQKIHELPDTKLSAITKSYSGGFIGDELTPVDKMCKQILGQQKGQKPIFWTTTTTKLLQKMRAKDFKQEMH